jgi:hypothetical protein
MRSGEVSDGFSADLLEARRDAGHLAGHLGGVLFSLVGASTESPILGLGSPHILDRGVPYYGLGSPLFFA